MTIRSRSTQFAAVAACLAFTGCAAHYTADAVQNPYGFWFGIWHGMVFPFALLTIIISWTASRPGVHL
jgi:hypothetical protein